MDLRTVLLLFIFILLLLALAHFIYCKFANLQTTVNGTSYQPSIASNTKKQAKTLCATVALQAMGMLPRNDLPATTATQPTAMPQMQFPMQPEPLPPHLDQQSFQAPHTLHSVPDIDLSSFR